MTAKTAMPRSCWMSWRNSLGTVLDTLLDKYADEGVEPDADATILRVTPFPQIGTPIELVNEFGGREGYEHAVRTLEDQIYAAV